MTQSPQDAPRPQNALPGRPSLAHLSGQAKRLLKAYRDRDTSAAERIARHHPQYSTMSPVEVLSRPLPLTHAQTVVAREYGFASWPDLKRHVQRTAPEAFDAFPQDVEVLCETQPDGRGLLLKTVVVAGEAYDYGDIFHAIYRLEGDSPNRTVRLPISTGARTLLLKHRVIVATDAYPPQHRWCRFYRGPGFGAYEDALDRAEKRLEDLHPRGRGHSWSFPPPTVETPPEDRDIHEVRIVEDEEQGYVQLLMGEMDTPYVLLLTPDQADRLGTGLAALVSSASPSDAAEPSPIACDTELEEVFLEFDRSRRRIEVWAEDWADEDARLVLGVAQADEICWQLREAAERLSSGNAQDRERGPDAGSGATVRKTVEGGGDEYDSGFEDDMFGPEIILFQPYCPTCDVTYLFRYESLPGFRDHNALPCPGCGEELGTVDSYPVLLKQVPGRVSDSLYEGSRNGDIDKQGWRNTGLFLCSSSLSQSSPL